MPGVRAGTGLARAALIGAGLLSLLLAGRLGWQLYHGATPDLLALGATAALTLGLSGWRRPLVQAALLTLLALGLYLANGQTSPSGDTRPNRFLPLALLRYRTFYLDLFPSLYAGETLYRAIPGAPPYYLHRIGSHLVSVYTVEAALPAVPFYLLPVLGGVDGASEQIPWLEKLAAASLTALSVGVLYLAVRERGSPAQAVLFSLAYAFGSSSFSTSSQGLYQHGPCQLALAFALLALRRGGEWIPAAGFALGFAVVCRPPALALALPLAVYAFFQHRRQLPGFVLAGLVWLLFQLSYNAIYLGHWERWPLGPPRHFPNHVSHEAFVAPASPMIWSGEGWLEGLQGVTCSPGRGLFVYSPIFLFSLLGVVRRRDPLVRWAGLGVACQVALLSVYQGWQGGHCYGPRMLAEATPLLAFCLYLPRRWPGRALFGLCLVLSVAAHALGAFHPTTWNQDMDVDRHREALFDWGNNPLVNPLRQQWEEWHRGGLPSTREAPQLTAVEFHGAIPRRVTAGGGVPLQVDARNRGTNFWRAGQLRLAWRWRRPDGTLLQPEGRVDLGHHVFPGDSYPFRTRVRCPAETGPLRLEVKLVAEPGYWLPDTLWLETSAEEPTPWSQEE